MDDASSVQPVLRVRFYRTPSGREPVREWLRARSRDDRRAVGADVKTVQYGWPVGMPLVRKMAPRLWEVRTHGNGCAIRVMFTIGDDMMLLLHAFEKTSSRTSRRDIEVARHRLAAAWTKEIE